MRAIITVGVPASGKTTFANEMVQKFGFRDINRDFIRFNLVKPGSTWATYKFTKANEKAVDEIHGKMIMESWQNEENIIISDTNLNKGRRRALIGRLQDLGYDGDEPLANIHAEYEDGHDYWYINENDIEVIE